MPDFDATLPPSPPSSAPLQYADWHSIALAQTLAGDRPTTKSLIDARGGSATTATAALREFHQVYLPDLLAASTLGAPPELRDLVAEIWRRLAAAAREAARQEWDKERAEHAALAQRAATDLATTQARARELEQQGAQMAATLRERDVLVTSLKERADALASELTDARGELTELGRTLAQSQRERDQLDGIAARARTDVADLKQALAALHESQTATLARHAADIERLATESASRTDRIEAEHAQRMERMEAAQAQALARVVADRDAAIGELAAERARHERARADMERRIEALHEAALRAESARDSYAAMAQAEQALRVPLEARIQDLAGERDRLLARIAADTPDNAPAAAQ